MKENIKRIAGWKKKRGYTLVELLAVMAISTIIMSISFNILVSGFRNLNEYYSFIKITCEIDDSLLNIERLLEEVKINKVEITTGVSSKLIINSDEGKGDTIKKNTIIFYDNKKIKVRRDKYYVYSGKLQSSGTNTVLNNVESFEIYKKDKLYYMYLKHESGEERIVCL